MIEVLPYHDLLTQKEHLQREGEQLKLILDSLPQAVSVIENETGLVIFANEAFCKLFQYRGDEIAGIGISHILENTTNVQSFSSCLTEAEENKLEVPCVKKDHSVFYADIHVKEIQYNDKCCSLYTFVSKPLYSHKQKALEEKLELFESFMKHSPVYAFIKEVDPRQSKVIFATDNYIDMIGISGSQMVGKNMFELFPPELAEKMTAADWEVVSNKEVIKVDEDLNGRYYTTIKYPINQNGTALLAGYTIDITERKLTEQALIEGEETLRSVFETMCEGFVLNELVYNSRNEIVDFKILKVNKAFYNLTNTSSDVELKLSSQVHGLAFDEMIKYLNLRKEGRESAHKEFYSARLDKHFFISTSPFINNRFVTIFFDITERKKAEQAVLENEIKLKRLNATKDKLFSIIAHDLRSPFNAILGYSEILGENIMNFELKKAEHYLEIINTSARNTLCLLENLLNWANSQTGQITFEPKTLSVKGALDDVLNVMNTSAVLKKIALNSYVSDGLLVYADRNMLYTILRNLISNAIKFSYPLGRINIYAIPLHDKIEFVVSDTGVGISDSLLPKLFDLETNYSTIGTSHERGSGLGLLLCKEFVEKHSGTISVESEVGKGSHFKFTLPAAPPSNLN
ncbi:MAG TPA: PAS domain-containing sensor histidine kinase [Bacteroidales bacterium]|nr:PAS domain-containing sensor histidine kinase [Bacteroidales bacterium]